MLINRLAMQIWVFGATSCDGELGGDRGAPPASNSRVASSGWEILRSRTDRLGTRNGIVNDNQVLTYEGSPVVMAAALPAGG